MPASEETWENCRTFSSRKVAATFAPDQPQPHHYAATDQMSAATRSCPVAPTKAPAGGHETCPAFAPASTSSRATARVCGRSALRARRSVACSGRFPELSTVPGVRLFELTLTDRMGEPAVVGLAGELQHRARDRHRYPVGGQLLDKRVHHFPGRWPATDTPPPS